MGAIEDYKNRQLIPRWRPSSETAERGELDPLQSIPHRFDEGMIEERLLDWKESPNLSVACDLIGVAFLLGLDKLVADAAQFVLARREATPIARWVASMSLRAAGVEVAREGLSDEEREDDISDGLQLTLAERGFALQIRKAKARLADFPHNPLLWSDLSRLYAAMGNARKAERCMQAALTLSPDNRLVLRAASRLFLHQDDNERAHQVLLRSSRLLYDPWLLSAEIALAATRKRRSRNIPNARRMVEAESHSPLNLSELSSSLGTIDILEGNRTRGKGLRLVQQSMRTPTENSIAQAGWLARCHQVIRVSERELARSPEANAWYAWRIGDWELAGKEARRWRIDQPFSTNPFILAANVADLGHGRYDQSIRILEEGRRINPDSVSILNNLAFALAQTDQLDRAKMIFSQIDATNLDEIKKIVLTATRGLIAFRSGEVVEGERLYMDAIEVSRRFDSWHCTIAHINLAMEKIRAGASDAVEWRRKALAMAEKRDEIWCRVMADRLRSYPETD